MNCFWILQAVIGISNPFSSLPSPKSAVDLHKYVLFRVAHIQKSIEPVPFGSLNHPSLIVTLRYSSAWLSLSQVGHTQINRSISPTITPACKYRNYRNEPHQTKCRLMYFLKIFSYIQTIADASKGDDLWTHCGSFWEFDITLKSKYGYQILPSSDGSLKRDVHF